MSDTVNTTETAQTGQTLDNNVSNRATTTQVVNVDPAVADAIKKAEQAQMEANMLRNKLKAIEEAEASAKAKQLEEQQEFKTLYEQEKAEREKLALEREQETKDQLVNTELQKITAKYAPEVLDIVKEAGIALTDITEEAIATYTSKLDKISEKVGSRVGVTANNTRTVVNEQSRADLLKQYRETGDRRAIDQAVAGLSFVKPYTQQ